MCRVFRVFHATAMRLTRLQYLGKYARSGRIGAPMAVPYRTNPRLPACFVEPTRPPCEKAVACQLSIPGWMMLMLLSYRMLIQHSLLPLSLPQQ